MWLKNWCVRLNSRAHFTRCRSEPMYSIFLYALFVTRCSFITGGRRPSKRLSLLFFFIRNTVYRIDYRLNTLNDRSLWKSREASVIQSRATATIRHAPRPFETYCSVCSWRIHCFDTHRSLLSFLPFREYPCDSSARSSENLKRAWRRHVRHFTQHLM